MAKRLPGDAYTRHVEAIKAFVSFRLPKRAKPADKRKAREYYKLIYGFRRADGEYVHGLFNPATDVPVRPRSEKQLSRLKHAEGQSPHKRIKVAFVESMEGPGGKLIRPKIRYRGGKVTKTLQGVTLEFYPFNDMSPGSDAGEDIVDEWVNREVKAVLRKAPQVTSWVVKCGKRQTKAPKSRRGIAAYVQSLTSRYDNHADWLFGLVAMEYPDAGTLDEFIESRKLTRKGNRGKKRKIRSRHRR